MGDSNYMEDTMMPTSERLILDNLKTLNDRLERYDGKFDDFNKKFDDKIELFTNKLEDKSERIVCTERDVKELTVRVSKIEAILDPTNKANKRYLVLAGLLALVNLIQISWQGLLSGILKKGP